LLQSLLSAKVEGADEAAKAVSMQAAAMNPIALDEIKFLRKLSIKN
jgi:translation elongation factor EF-Ts